MLAKEIDNIKFVYCKRSVNELTHKIAKEIYKASCQNLSDYTKKIANSE